MHLGRDHPMRGLSAKKSFSPWQGLLIAATEDCIVSLAPCSCASLMFTLMVCRVYVHPPPDQGLAQLLGLQVVLSNVQRQRMYAGNLLLD